jgi:uncharacterized protein (DUF924 family)
LRQMQRTHSILRRLGRLPVRNASPVLPRMFQRKGYLD